MVELVWEYVQGLDKESGGQSCGVRRAEVPGGWLVRLSESVTFVPDPTHSWK